MPLLRELQAWARSYVREHRLRIPAAEINSIIAGLTGLPKEYLLIHQDTAVPAGDAGKIKRALKKRGEQYPLQYLTGAVEFMGIDFRVRPGVLIPRPETEVLVETAVPYTTARKHTTVLDLCCGSGVVGLSIARMNQRTHITFCDISRRAVHLAQENARMLDLTARSVFFQGDLFSPLPGASRFDLIVANPPYVPHTRMPALQKEVLYEPATSLDGGKRGIEIIRRIVDQAGRFLNDAGVLIIEHDDTHRKYMESLCPSSEATTLRYVRTINDLSGRPRVSVFYRAGDTHGVIR